MIMYGVDNALGLLIRCLGEINLTIRLSYGLLGVYYCRVIQMLYNSPPRITPHLE
ncbi:unnamed protein product [Arabidopsis halleri]